MKPKELKTKISHAHSLILSLTLILSAVSLTLCCLTGKKLDEEAAREYDVDRTEDENAAAMAAFDAL